MQERRWKRSLLCKALARMRSIKQVHAWQSWLEAVELRSSKRAAMAKALAHSRSTLMAKAWRSWQQHLAARREKRRIVNRCAIGCISAGSLGSWKAQQGLERRIVRARGRHLLTN